MNRRDMLKMISLATGSALIGGEVLFSACTPDRRDYRSPNFSKDEIDLLAEIAETILPRTTTPGAKDANVAEFMTKIVDNCYYEADTKTFRDGLNQIEVASNAKFEKKFRDITAGQRTQMLVELDAEAKAYKRPEGGTSHYFTMYKQLVLFGFFTSEVGQTKVLRHVPIPGRYDGNVDYKNGDTAWALG